MIELERVTKRFGEVVALREVDFRVGKGEVVLLTGPSGAGKSTLLKLLFVAARADEGGVRVCGRDIARLRASAIPYLRRNIGVVFQDFKLLADRTARENVAVAMEILGMGRAEAGRRAEVALDAVGLLGKAGARADHLSGGEQQRVAVARAIVGTPEIILADEPTGNLDPERALDLLELFDLLRGRGVTRVIATHDPDVIAFGESRLWRRVKIDAGRIVEDELTIEEARPADAEAAVDALPGTPADGAREPAATEARVA
jgi:cell division transport system ATP-binding protein